MEFDITIIDLTSSRHFNALANDGINPDDAYTHAVICESTLTEDEAAEAGLFSQMYSAMKAAGLESSTDTILTVEDAYGDKVYAILDCWKA